MRIKLSQIGLVAVSAIIVAGCANAPLATGDSSAAAGSGDAEMDTGASGGSGIDAAQGQSQAALLEERDAEIARLQAELDRQQAMTAEADSMGTAAADSGGNSLFPPDPRPGECYARVIIPATYETTDEQVLAREATEEVEIIPAEYEMAEESVVTKEAATKLEVVPAVYETITEDVLVKPASTAIEQVPAEYDIVKEEVLETEARTEWKRGTGIGTGASLGGAAAQVTRFEGQKVLDTKVVEDTGEVMCLVEVPATYKTIEKKVLVKPAMTREVEVPAEYETITKTVLAQPATTREVEVPAEYGTVKVARIVTPASERRVPVPAEYTTVTSRKKLTDEQIVWRPVLCEVNMTQQNVQALQTAISSESPGCWTCGRADGLIGPCTLKATRCYASQNNLSSGDKYVTIETIRHLGLEF